MTVKREKYRDGVFVGERLVSNDDDILSPEDIEEYFKEMFDDPFRVENVLKIIENEIIEIIEDKSSSAVRKSNAEAALSRFKQVRIYLDQGEPKAVFINTYHMMTNMWKAKIRPFEHSIFHFEKEHANFGKKAVLPRVDNADHITWRETAAQVQAERIKKGSKPLSSRALSSVVKANLKLTGKGTSIERVRKVISEKN